MDSSNLYYLRQMVQVEPLVNNWYAWSFLISPATTAMIMANSHLPIMESYIRSPELHEAAVKKPEMLGGPFIDYPVRQIEKINNMKINTEEKLQYSLELAVAFQGLANLLKEKGNGQSLEALYTEIPQVLRGYVELVYDLDNKPSFRIMESLLYQSKYYLKESQSVALSLINEDYRPFCLSTPRLINPQQLHIKLPYEDKFYDKLFSLKESPMPLNYIEGMFKEIPCSDAKSWELFRSFLTAEPPQRNIDNRNYTENDIRVRYFGHACILIESNDCNILIDPVISYQYPNGIKRYTYSDLPDVIDYLVITHAHQDHVLLEHLLQLRHKVKCVVVPRSGSGFLQDPSLKLFFKHFGYKNVIEIDELESISIAGGSITGIPFLGEHSDLNIRTKIAHLIELKGKKILCAADSNNIEPLMYKYVHDVVGNIDVLFIGMECDGAPLSWLYGSLLTTPVSRQMDQSRRLSGSNYDRAIAIVDQFSCEQVYVYAMGQEPWLNYIMSIKYDENSKPYIESTKLISECVSRGIKSERLFGIKDIYV